MNQRKKILFLIHTLGGGGAEKALVNLVKALPVEVWDITVKTVVNTGRYRRELPNHIRYESMISVPVLNREEKSNDSGSLLATKNSLKLLLARLYTLFWRLMPAKTLYSWASGSECYDYVVAYLEGITTKIVSGCQEPRTRKIAWVHVDLSVQGKSHSVYGSARDELAVYKSFDRIVCVSDYVARTFRDLFEEVSDKVTVCHNILDSEAVVKLSRESTYCACHKSDASSNDRVIRVVSVGRLNWQKGYDRLLEAASKVRDKGLVAFHIDIVGTGTARKQLEERLHELELEDHVAFIGYLDNPYPYIAAADLFVAPSRTEGLSTVVAESLALGCPVLVTDCSGMRELIGGSEAGLIVPNTVDGIADGLATLFADKKVLIRYAERAKLMGNPLTPSRGVCEFTKAVLGG